jgi:hypothetical protein
MYTITVARKGSKGYLNIDQCRGNLIKMHNGDVVRKKDGWFTHGGTGGLWENSLRRLHNLPELGRWPANILILKNLNFPENMLLFFKAV